MFVRPEEILMDLARTYKSKTFGLSDIIEWCMQVECDHIGDIDIMNKYVLQARVVRGKITLPLNIYRILVVYDEYGKVVEKKGINTVYLHGLSEYEGKVLTVEFMGVPLDEDCMPLVAASHKEACKKYCIMQLFADEAETNINMYKIQQNRTAEFAGLVIKAKQGFREWTRDAIASLSRHSYNQPFKDHFRRVAERMGDTSFINRSTEISQLNCLRNDFSNINFDDIPDSMNIRHLFDDYVALINANLNARINAKSFTFELGVDGTFASNIWTIPLLSTMEITTFESSAITVYANNIMVLAPITCNALSIVIDFSSIGYDSGKTYTVAVVPPSI